MRYLISIDDTDSRLGHCTTHLGYLIASGVSRIGCTLPTYPRLVRLNPNIPFKTRGNAAVCIELEAESEGLSNEAFRVAERLLVQESDVENGANSALVMTRRDEHPGFFRGVYRRAVNGVVSYRRLLRDVSSLGIRHKLLGNGMGIVGASAALGFSPDLDDHTYELIAYRRPENCGTRRALEPESVVEMEAATFPHTFNNFDHESGRVLVAPTGPDPVFAGVRGDSPGVVVQAFREIRMGERPLGYVVYATNQCTDAHLVERLSTPLKAFSAGWVQGIVVSTEPSRGGHLKLKVRAKGCSDLVAMVYEPSGDLRQVARHLRPGDSVRLYGGVRRASSKNPAVVNVERLDLISHGPEGRSRDWIRRGTYLASPRAQRHLTKQLIRYGNESAGSHPLVEGWLLPPPGIHAMIGKNGLITTVGVDVY